MTFKGELRPFQQEPFNRMVEGGALLLALDKGLGKTVVSIAAVETLIDQGDITNGFVICSSPLKKQWYRQIQHFSGGDARILIVEGTPAKRRDTYIRYRNNEAEYLILNPDLLVPDWDVLSILPRDFIIADEATFFKNFQPKRSRRMKRLKAKYRWALTGQPIENRAEEVFSIMQWVDKELLGDFETFDATFIVRNPWGGVSRCKNLPALRELLTRRMVRISRRDVAHLMPGIITEDLIIDMDPSIIKLYKIMAEDLLRDLDEALQTFGTFDIFQHYAGEESGTMRGKIMSKIMCLRMLCDHPELLRISAGHYNATQAAAGGSKSGSAYAAELKERGLLDKDYKSAKLDVALDEIQQILEADPGNKVVLFSFFKDMLRIIGERFTALKLGKAVFFTGDLSNNQRDASKQQFESDPDTRLFLSSDAGGYGLDIPEANYLISYDLPWSAGSFDQRNSRIIRLSSQFDDVTLMTLQTSESVEEWQFAKLLMKMKLGEAIVDGRGADAQGRLNLSIDSLRSFLEESLLKL